MRKMIDADCAADLEGHIIKLVSETNEILDGAKFFYNGLKYLGNAYESERYFCRFDGWIGFDRYFPEFMSEEEKEIWTSNIRLYEKREALGLIQNNQFGGIDPRLIEIIFSGQSKEGLYRLNQFRKAFLNAVFKSIMDYVRWHVSVVDRYNRLKVKNRKNIKKYLDHSIKDLVTF